MPPSMNPMDLVDPLFNLPQEVSTDPVPFVALCGLDVVHNATHRVIWDGFATNRSGDRLPILYRSLAADHEFPVSKVKKSYEYGTVPGGILKSNWIKKHLYEIPALVVLFVDLEWDDPAFAEKKIACSSKVATIRASLAGRNTRIALVLIQSRPHTFAPGEPSPDAEKITGMCNACELAFKQLFLLPNNEHLTSYVVKLEAALFETVQQYYLNEAKRVRGHRDAVMRMQATNLPLLVRHQFKIGYFNEFRQDRQTALKHYQQSYQNLQQIRQDGGFEVKTVAMIIMYRICRLSFRLNCPKDAIVIFRQHLEGFRLYRGPPDLAYQHEAWIFRQYFIFANLFNEAVQSGLAALSSENPGMYFSKAAEHMKLRQRNCVNFPPQQIPFQPTPPTEGEFYGQLILSVPSSLGDMPIAVYLQNCERTVNHTGWMIHLLSSAVAQFKKHRCHKTALMLLSRIGDEYCDVGLYEKAHMLFSQGLNEYRKSKWSVIFSQILLRQIRVCALIPDAADFLKGTLEAIGADSYLQLEDRSALQETLLQILSGGRPDFRSLLGSQSQIAYQKWGSLTPEGLTCSLDMDDLLPCVEHTCTFDKPAFEAHQMISVTIKLMLTSPLPLQLSELHLFLSNPSYNRFCAVDDSFSATNSSENKLYLIPGEEKVFQFEFPCNPEDVGKRLEMARLVLKLGSHISLAWNSFGRSRRSRQANLCGQTFKIRDPTSDNVFHSVDIIRRPALAEIVLPAKKTILIGEILKLPIIILNKESGKIEKAFVGMTCDDRAVMGSNKLTFATGSPEHFANECASEPVELEAGQEHQVDFFVQCNVGFETNVKVILSYELKDPVYRCWTQSVFSLEALSPLQIKFLSREFHSEEYPSEKHVMPPGEDLIYFFVIRNAAPIRIRLVSAEFEFKGRALQPFIPVQSHIAGIELGEDEEAQDALFLRLDASCLPGSSIPMGPLNLTWNRVGSEQAPALTQVTVPDMLIKASSSPLKVSLVLPARVTQFEPLSLVYQIKNISDQLLDIHAMLSTNDEYVLAGEKETRVRLGPHMETALHSAIVPINVGYMRLPEFEINTSTDADCREWIDSHLPKTVFVMPKELGEGTVQVGVEGQSGAISV